MDGKRNRMADFMGGSEEAGVVFGAEEGWEVRWMWRWDEQSRRLSGLWLYWEACVGR